MSTTSTSTQTSPRNSPHLCSIRLKSSPTDITGYLKPTKSHIGMGLATLGALGPQKSPHDPFLRPYIKSHHVNIANPKSNVLIIRPKKSIKPLIAYPQPDQAHPHPHPQVHKSHTDINDYDSHYNLIKKSIPQISLKSKLVKHVPSDFVGCDLGDLIILVSRMLTNLIDLNDKLVPQFSTDDKKKSALTRYHSRVPPNISPLNYLSRLSKFNNFSNATLLTTIYYIDLLSFNYQPFFTLNSWTVHRFLLVATMTCQKSMEDFFFTNDHYAKVGGVNLNELNYLELDFLTRINWKCVPSRGSEKNSIKHSKSVLDLYYNQLVELMGKNSGVSEFIYSFESHSDMDHSNLAHLKRRYPE